MDVMDVSEEDVFCDKPRLNQVLLNFLSNTIKFAPARGTVSVRVAQLSGADHGAELENQGIICIRPALCGRK